MIYFYHEVKSCRPVNFTDSTTQPFQGPLAVIYFYLLITIGTWFLLNLFTAILIKAFAEQKVPL